MSKCVVTNLAKAKIVKARAGLIATLPIVVGMAFGNGARNGNDYREAVSSDTELQNELLRQDIDKSELQADGISVLYSCTLAKDTLGGCDINEIALYDSEGDLVVIKTFTNKGKDDDMEMVFSILDQFVD